MTALIFFAILGLTAVAIDMRRELERKERQRAEFERAWQDLGGR